MAGAIGNASKAQGLGAGVGFWVHFSRSMTSEMLREWQAIGNASKVRGLGQGFSVRV